MHIALAFVMLLAATQNFETKAREILDNIVARDFEAATKDFGERVLAGLPPERFKQVYDTQIAPQLGVLKSTDTPLVTKSDDETIVTIPATFEKAQMNFIVGFDPAGKVTQIWFRPPNAKAPEPAPTRFADYATKTRLSLPFDGEWTIVWGGRTQEQNYHVITRDQRFAYDILIRRDGKTHSGSGKTNEEYYCWDAALRAPADGVVVTLVDGVADNTPGQMDPRNAAGNHIVIDHGNGEYSFLAHFRNGTLLPKLGDRVKRNQLLGRCGNSGNSSEPHLHYHLQTGKSFGEGEGLPAQFADYVADGKRVARGEPVKGQRVSRR